MYRQEMLRHSLYPAGDYYRGGYYPAGGFFGSLGKAIKKVGGAALKAAAPSLASLVPGGAAMLAVGKGLMQGMGGPLATGPAASLNQKIQTQIVGPSGLGNVFAAKKGATSGGGAGGGWTGGQGMLIGKKRRRMNPLNPRALRRSMSRVQSFARFARKTISFTSRVKMKKRRGRR